MAAGGPQMLATSNVTGQNMPRCLSYCTIWKYHWLLLLLLLLLSDHVISISTNMILEISRV